MPLPKHWDRILNSMTQTSKKCDSHQVFNRPNFWLVWRYHGIADDFENFLKVPIWKLLNYSYAQSSVSTTSRNTDNSILKYTLQLKILWIWIKIRPNSFIKTWVNVIKQKSTKVPEKLPVAQKSKPELQRTSHQKRWHLFLYATFSFKQTLFLSLTQSSLANSINFATIYLPFYLLIVDILQILQFI